MKSIHIALIVLIIALVAGFVVYSKKPTETASTTTEEKTEEVKDATMPTAAEHGMTEEEHAKMMMDQPMGTDVGMELPETDMSGMDHSNMNMGAMDHSTMNMQTDPSAKVFKISGKNFAFDVTEIRVKQGDTVTVEFDSADGFHDWVVDEFSARTEKIKTGNTSKVTFVADKKGTFEYYCSVGQHRMNGMVGKLIVE